LTACAANPLRWFLRKLIGVPRMSPCF